MPSSKTILIVEDNPQFRRTLVAYLEDCGYYVVQAGDGEQALSILKVVEPDIVLTDLHMPIVDGFEVMAHMHANKPHIPIIVITGTGNEIVRPTVLKHGARECLFKPIPDLQQLEAVIDRVLPWMPERDR